MQNQVQEFFLTSAFTLRVGHYAFKEIDFFFPLFLRISNFESVLLPSVSAVVVYRFVCALLFCNTFNQGFCYCQYLNSLLIPK